MAIVLTLTNTELYPANPAFGGPAVSYSNGNITNSKNRIGEYKLLRLYFTTNLTIANMKLFVNPALFLNKTAINPLLGFGAGTNYYSYTFGPSVTSGSAYATYTSLGSINPLVDYLDLVQIVWTSSTAFQVLIYYYQAYDFQGFLDPNTGDNHSRLLKDKKSNTSELTVNGNSIYNDTNIDLRAYIYMEHTAVPTHNGYYDFNPGYGYKAGFYEKGNTNTSPYFTNPTLILSRPAGVTTALSSVEDTDVEFKITSPSLAVTYFAATIIRTDKYDNTVDWKTNYEFEQVCVDGSSTPTTKMKSFTGVTSLGGGVYACYFKVDKTGLTLGAKYRIIMHTYNNEITPSYEVDAYISDEFSVNADVPYTGNGFDVTARLGDTMYNYSGNYLTCCIEERMRSWIRLDYLDDYGIDTYIRDIYNRLGLTITDVRRYLTQIEFRIWDKTSSPGYSHLLEQRTAYKTTPTTYSNGRVIQTTFAAGLITLITLWRNRYESGIPNIQTYDAVTGVAYGPMSIQYWGGKTLDIEWVLTFYYDDYITPFTDALVIQQKMVVKDYETCVEIHAVNAPDEDLEFWCPDDTMALRAEVTNVGCYGGAAPSSFYLMTTIEPDPGTITTIEENESFVPYQLSQFTSSKILTQETYFSQSLADNALFTVDVAALSYIDYKISALAKRT